MKGLIYKLLIKVWDTENIPKYWKYGIIYPIYKKGDMICDNYRAIRLMSTAWKILGNALHLRLMSYAEEVIGEHQGGFRCDRSTTNQIFTIRQIFENCWEHNIEVNCLFIEFKSAYESIFREQI